VFGQTNGVHSQLICLFCLLARFVFFFVVVVVLIVLLLFFSFIILVT
jgi:hypothetical protein